MCCVCQNAEPEFSHEEVLDRLRLRDILQNNWPVLYKCQGHESQNVPDWRRCDKLRALCDPGPVKGHWCSNWQKICIGLALNYLINLDD